MNKYFSLYQHCKYASGTLNGCIYNTLNGQMIKVNGELSRLLEESFHNIPQDVNNKELLSLINLGYGDFYDSPTMHENYLKYENRQAKYNLMIGNINLYQVYIILESKCNLECDFCNESNYVYTMTHCKKRAEFNTTLSVSEVLSILKKCKKMGARKLSIIGGNPFLNFDIVKNIVESVKGYDTIQIYANILQLDDNIITFLSDNNIELVVEIVQCSDIEFSNLIKLLENKINIKIDILLWKRTAVLVQDFYEKIMRIGEIQADNIIISNVYSPAFSANNVSIKKRAFHSFSSQSLELSEIYNSCLYGKIAIRLDGVVMPCPMMDNYVIGNLKYEKLTTLLSDSKYQTIIHYSRNKIKGCEKCAYKNNCFDCRSLEYSQSGVLDGCAYCEINERLLSYDDQ